MTRVFPQQQPRDPKPFPGGVLFLHVSHLSIKGVVVHMHTFVHREAGGQSWGCLAQWLGTLFFETECLIKPEAR